MKHPSTTPAGSSPAHAGPVCLHESPTPHLPADDLGATTAELAVWVVLGLAFVGTVFSFATPVAARLGERITSLIP